MMEPRFQSTFIPKRPIISQNVAEPPRRRRSFFSIAVMLIFILSLIAAGAAFGYAKYLEADISKKDQALQDAVNKLQPDVINELATVDAQLQSAKNVLYEHLVPSRFFGHLEDITLQSVRFTNFSYTATPGEAPSIEMTGMADDYASVALQSDVFARDEFIQMPLFSGLNVSEKGGVVFDVDATSKSALTTYGSE